MTPGAPPRHEALLAEIRAEFPGFAIVRKRGQALQSVIAVVLAIVTLGGQRHYLTRYHTVLFGKLYVPDAGTRWTTAPATSSFVTSACTSASAAAWATSSWPSCTSCRSCPCFSRGGARASSGKRTSRPSARPQSFTASTRRDALEDEIVRRFVGPDYGWMWPFPQTVRRWFRAGHRGPRGRGRPRPSAGRRSNRAKSLPMAVVGIDLGTTNTVVACVRGGRVARAGGRAGPAPLAQRRLVPPERRRSSSGTRREGAPRRRRQEHRRERQAPHRPRVGAARRSIAPGSGSRSS